jgi:hypothetical protein
MSAMKDAMMEMGERGFLLCDKEEQYRWQDAIGSLLPVTGVMLECRDGTQVGVNGLPAAVARSIAADERLPESERENIRWRLEVAGLDGEGDEIARWLNRKAASCRRTASRLAGEIIAAVTAGDEMPEEWYRMDAYAEIGEPIAWEVCRLVREELAGTGIRV